MDLPRRVPAPRQALADQDRVGPGGAHPQHVRARGDAALGDQARAAGRARDEPLGRREVGRERRQIPVVDPDESGPEPGGPLQLRLAMHLDEGGQPETLRGLEQVRELTRLEDRHDQEDRVGPVRPGLPNLILVDDEVLLEEWRVDQAPDRVEVVETPVEVGIGVDGEGHGASPHVLGRPRHGIPAAGEDARHRRGALELGEQPDLTMRARRQDGDQVTGRRPAVDTRREPAPRHGGLAGGDGGPLGDDDLVEEPHGIRSRPALHRGAEGRVTPARARRARTPGWCGAAGDPWRDARSG